MKASKVIETGIVRATYSRTAIKMKNFEFSNPVETVFVSENAPESIRLTGTTPKKEGWKEYNGKLENIGNPYTSVEVWIKTATKGGRSRTWVRNCK